MNEREGFNAQVIAEFRANGGKVAQFGDQPMVILHTIGARSGEEREIPLAVGVDGDELLVFANDGGAPRHPSWYFNLKAHPRIEVEMGADRFQADVVELPEAEAQRKRDAVASAEPQFAKSVEAAAPRAIPVFSITRVD